ERELRAQIDKALAAGVRPTHLDGHKHAHLAPRVLSLVVRLAVEYGIRGVRCATETNAALVSTIRANRGAAVALAKQNVVGRGLSMLAARGRRGVRRAGLRSPARLVGVTETGFLGLDTLLCIIETLGDRATELMCHPGYVDDGLRAQPTRLTAS